MKKRTCNNCAWLNVDCIVEPDDRERSASNCDQYKSLSDYMEERYNEMRRTGEYYDPRFDY